MSDDQTPTFTTTQFPALQSTVGSLLPSLHEKRKLEHKALKKNIGTLFALPAGCYVIDGVALSGSTGGLVGDLLVEAAITLFSGFSGIWIYKKNKAYQEDVLKTHIQAVEQEYGEINYLKQPKWVEFGDFIRNGLLLPYERGQVPAHMSGTYKDIPFSCSTLMAQARIRNRYQPVFSGMLLKFTMPRSIGGTIRLAPKKNPITGFNQKNINKRDGFHESFIDDIEFSSVFKAYTSIEYTADVLLDSNLRRTILDLVNLDKRHLSMTITIEDNQVFIALPRRQKLFQPFGFFLPFEKNIEKQSEKLFTELTLPHRMIDVLTS